MDATDGAGEWLPTLIGLSAERRAAALWMVIGYGVPPCYAAEDLAHAPPETIKEYAEASWATGLVDWPRSDLAPAAITAAMEAEDRHRHSSREERVRAMLEAAREVEG